MRASRRVVHVQDQVAPKASVSIGLLYEVEGRKRLKQGVIVIADGPVAPRPFWELVHRIAACSEWLRGTFAIATRPRGYGIVHADGGPPAITFRGVWRTPPQLALLIGGTSIAESVLVSEVARCFAPAAPSAGDPFQRWAVSDRSATVAVGGGEVAASRGTP